MPPTCLPELAGEEETAPSSLAETVWGRMEGSAKAVCYRVSLSAQLIP